MRELSPSQGHESTSVTLGEFIADSVAASLRSGGGYALGNSDLDAGGQHGNIDSEFCYETPDVIPPPK